jgi:hypothetical protein
MLRIRGYEVSNPHNSTYHYVSQRFYVKGWGKKDNILKIIGMGVVWDQDP